LPPTPGRSEANDDDDDDDDDDAAAPSAVLGRDRPEAATAWAAVGAMPLLPRSAWNDLRSGDVDAGPLEGLGTAGAEAEAEVDAEVAGRGRGRGRGALLLGPVAAARAAPGGRPAAGAMLPVCE